MCFISYEFFSQSIARRSEVSNACIFVECRFVRFDSNQNSTNFNKTPHFEFNETFLSGSHTKVIDAMHFQILKNHSMWKQKIYNFSIFYSKNGHYQYPTQFSRMSDNAGRMLCFTLS